jgi:hypothetical protein
MVGLLAMVLAVLARGLPRGTNPLGRNGPSLFGLQKRLEEEDARTVLITRKQQALLRGMQEKNRIIDELIARRLPLAEAVARFKEVSDPIPGYHRDLIRNHYQGGTPEESIGRWVVEGVRAKLEERGQDPALADRLEAELQCHVECGTLRR